MRYLIQTNQIHTLWRYNKKIMNNEENKQKPETLDAVTHTHTHTQYTSTERE